jgi:hypothetical protein
MTTHLDDRSIVRQDHYGPRHQAWDSILELGWAPEFAAGNILKYLRRTKSPKHSLESANWYHDRLVSMSQGYWTEDRQRAGDVRQRLYEILTDAERVSIGRGPPNDR